MLDEVRALLVLQDRDRRLLAIGKDMDRLPQDEARAKTKMAGDEAAVKKAHEAVMECDLRIKRLELDAGTRKTTIIRLKTQQFETRKNDEFQALGHEITRYEQEVDSLETRELELMEEMDAARATEAEARAALEKTKTFVSEDLAAISDRKKHLESQRAEVSAERAELAGKVPSSVMPLYQRLMKTKDGLAVAPIAEGKCGGCHMRLIPTTVVAVTAAKQIAQCENCGRILYAAG